MEGHAAALHGVDLIVKGKLELHLALHYESICLICQICGEMYRQGSIMMASTAQS